MKMQSARWPPYDGSMILAAMKEAGAKQAVVGAARMLERLVR
jgi:hypothetical protein